MIKNIWSCLTRQLRAINAYHSVHNDLGRLSNRSLADIGISRCQIDYYAIRAYYKAKEG